MLRTIAAAVAVLATFPAFAAQRQFVASYGNDVNPCTLTQPCRGFAAAATAVDPGGEIIVLDSAGYGPVTLTKSVSIISPAGIYAGISVPVGQDGIVINAPGIRVTLEGLTINGTGGNFGIRMLAGNTLRIARCHVTSMSLTGIAIVAPAVSVEIRDSSAFANSGAGFAVVGSSFVDIESSTFSQNAQNGILIGDGAAAALKNVAATLNGAFGVFVTAGSGASARATIDQAKVEGNSQSGVQAGTAGTGIATLDITRSVISHNGNGVAAVSSGGTGTAYLTATNNVISENVLDGVSANGAGAVAVASSNTISRNFGVGLLGTGGGLVNTSQDNVLLFNVTNLSPGVVPFIKG